MFYCIPWIIIHTELHRRFESNAHHSNTHWTETKPANGPKIFICTWDAAAFVVQILFDHIPIVGIDKWSGHRRDSLNSLLQQWLGWVAHQAFLQLSKAMSGYIVKQYNNTQCNTMLPAYLMTREKLAILFMQDHYKVNDQSHWNNMRMLDHARPCHIPTQYFTSFFCLDSGILEH